MMTVELAHFLCTSRDSVTRFLVGSSGRAWVYSASMSGWHINAEEWEKRLRDEGEIALADLFDQLRAHLRNTVGFRMDPRLRGRVDPSDIIQDAFVEAANRLSEYTARSDMPIHLWVRFLTVQQLLITHRKHLHTQARDAGREVRLQSPADTNISSECLVIELMAAGPSPSGEVEEAERAAKLLEALEGMEPIDREVLTLRHFEQLSNIETAKVLDIQPGTASVRYFRALERLREILSDTNL